MLSILCVCVVCPSVKDGVLNLSLCVAVCGQRCWTGNLVSEESCRGGGFLQYHLRHACGDQL